MESLVSVFKKLFTIKYLVPGLLCATAGSNAMCFAAMLITGTSLAFEPFPAILIGEFILSVLCSAFGFWVMLRQGWLKEP